MKSRILFLIPCFVLVTCSVDQDCQKADIILFNTKVYTVDDSNSIAEAIAIKGKEIVYVGDNKGVKNYKCSKSRIIDLKNGYIFPGFTDSHAHLKGIGYRENTLNLQGINSLKETMSIVEEFTKSKKPGEWLVGRGWIEKVWPEKRFPNKYDLDRFSKNNPLLLERADGHAVLVNSYALKLAGIDSNSIDPHGGAILRDKHGEVTGILIDRATNLVEKLVPKKTPEEDKFALEQGIKRSIKLGWTQIQNAGGSIQDLELLKKIKSEGNLLLRIYFSVSDGIPAEELLNKGPYLDKDNMLIARGIKLYADGALGSRGAYLKDNYSDSKTKGLLIFKKEETIPKLKDALKKGIQIQTHAIGDLANHITLNWYEEAFDSVPLEERSILNPRWRIEHSQNIQPEDQTRFNKLGIIASMQPSHAIGDLHFAVDRLGLKRIKNAYIWKSLLDQGVLVIGGTDAPVEIGDPLIEFYAAVTRKDVDGFYTEDWNLEQVITREEALKMFTIWPSYGAFQEKVRGSLEVGKLADLSVFSKDIMEISEEDILEARNIMTLVDGKIVYENL